MPKIKVVLSGAGGVLDRQVIDVPNDADAIDDAVSNVIEGWTLSVGDTIRIIDADAADE